MLVVPVQSYVAACAGMTERSEINPSAAIMLETPRDLADVIWGVVFIVWWFWGYLWLEPFRDEFQLLSLPSQRGLVLQLRI